MSQVERKTMTHGDVVDELRGLRKILRRDMETHEIAALAGVTVQTLKQYCQIPGTRGARLIPGERLDILRNEAALRHHLHWSRAQVPGHPRAERQWLVMTTDLDPVLDVTFQSYAECYAARHGGLVVRGPENTGRRDHMTAADWLSADWLEVRHSGLVTKQDAMTVTGTDEWIEGLVSYEFPGLRIVPTRQEIDALRAIAERGRLHDAP